MAKDLTMGVDDQMLTCLEIMAHGEDMLAIGAWEAPIKRLAMREYAVKVGNGYRITKGGEAFLASEGGVSVEEITAMAPVHPDWIITPLPSGGVVILRKNELAVSGYEAMGARWVPVVHGQTNEIDTMTLHGDADGFLQAVLDVAWARGLRPTSVNDNVE